MSAAILVVYEIEQHAKADCYALLHSFSVLISKDRISTCVPITTQVY